MHTYSGVQAISKQEAVVIYDTMWGSTDKMARAIADGIISQGIEVKLLKLRATSNTDAVTEVLEAKAVIVGSPTLNNQMFPTVSSFLTYITGLKPKGKLWSFFGSYRLGRRRSARHDGNGKESRLSKFKKQGVEVKYVPDEEDLKKCFDFGQQIAQKIKA